MKALWQVQTLSILENYACNVAWEWRAGLVRYTRRKAEVCKN